MNASLPLYRADDARAIDHYAIATLGIPGYLLMTRAGQTAFDALRARWPEARCIGVACGPGNNGGDGYVLARLAHDAGLDVRVIALGPAGGGDAALAEADLRAAGVEPAGFADALPPVDVWVDALFGTGLSRAPTDAAAQLIAAMNEAGRPVLALDVPSGVNADTGAVPGVAVTAELTVSFICAKRGLFTGPALDHVGVHRLDDLAVPAAARQGLSARAVAYDSDALSNWLRPRPRDSHKNRFGHVLCVGGDIGMGGAIRLCAEAALRSGAGVVSVATRSDNVAALVSARPEAMARPVEDADDFPPLLTRADVVAIGPGLGQGDWGRALWRATLASGKALVLDADALNLLAAAPRGLPDAVLTPHPGEAARLLGCTGAEIQADRFAAAAALAERYQSVVVLKGAGSIVAAPGRTPAVIAAGNPGMAVAGMGDLLTGAVAALRAQGLSPFDAAVCGALLHASAGDAAAGDGQRGLLPSDLLPELRRLANPERTGR